MEGETSQPSLCHFAQPTPPPPLLVFFIFFFMVTGPLCLFNPSNRGFHLGKRDLWSPDAVGRERSTAFHSPCKSPHVSEVNCWLGCNFVTFLPQRPAPRVWCGDSVITGARQKPCFSLLLQSWACAHGCTVTAIQLQPHFPLQETGGC